MSGVFGSAAAGFVIILLIVLVVALLMVMVNMNLRMNRLQRRYQLFMKGSDGQSVEKAMTSRLREIGKIRSRQEKSREDLIDLKQQYNSMLCKYGIVKYDAFEDVGGKMSFALAMLDQNNTGFVLNAIHSRDNCYLYLKDVVKGTSYIMLSDEEVEALRRASRFGEDETAAAATRRMKRDEERARKAAAEEAKIERRQAAQAAGRKRRVETPEEAELRMLEEIIANAENKASEAGSAQAERMSGTRASVVSTRETNARESAAPARQETEVMSTRQNADISSETRSDGRSTQEREAALFRQQTSLGLDQPIVEATEGPAAAEPRRRAAARRIEDGMPELTE